MTVGSAVRTGLRVIRLYEQLAGTVKRMLTLAKAKQWSTLADLDAEGSAIVRQLQHFESQLHELDALQRSRVMDLIVRIQADQAALATLVQPQFIRLIRTIDTLQRQQKVQGAYGPPT